MTRTTPITFGKAFVDGAKFSIALDALIDSRMLIQANSGGGKSYAVRSLLERTHGYVQQIVIDPEGEFSTLRERFDYVIAAPSGGDALAHPKTAKILAERLLETGVSAIADIYELKPYERTSFVRIFLDAMVNAPKHLWHPCLIILDEAHVYAPESDKSEAHGAVADIATRGRKRGFCLVAATQRISKLSKDVAAELNNKLIGRATLDVDVKRAAAELGIPTGDALVKLRNLDPGQFYAFGPATNVRSPTLMTVGEVVTRHPRRGERASATPKPTAAILDVLPKLADLPKEAEAEARTLDDLRRELTTVRRQLATATREKPAPKQELKKDAAEAKRLRAALGEVMKLLIQIKAFEFSDGNKLDTARLQKAVETAVATAGEMAQKRIESSARDIARLQADVQKSFDRINRMLTEDSMTVSLEVQKNPPVSVRVALARREPAEVTEGISRPQQKILDAMAWLRDKGVNPMQKNTVAAVAGVSPTSGGYRNNLSILVTGGLIEYPVPGTVAFTEAGSAAANAPDTSGEVHEKWIEIVPEPQRKILRALLDAHPDPIEKEGLAAVIGVSATSGGFRNNLSALRTLGAIDYPTPGSAALTQHVMP